MVNYKQKRVFKTRKMSKNFDRPISWLKMRFFCNQIFYHASVLKALITLGLHQSIWFTKNVFSNFRASEKIYFWIFNSLLNLFLKFLNNSEKSNFINIFYLNFHRTFIVPLLRVVIFLCALLWHYIIAHYRIIIYIYI